MLLLIQFPAMMTGVGVVREQETGSLGIVLATFTNSTAQFGMLALPVPLALTLLSGSLTPLESMPVWLQNVMQLAPTTHLVNFAQEVSYRGADFEIVWTDLAAFSALTLEAGHLFTGGKHEPACPCPPGA